MNRIFPVGVQLVSEEEKLQSQRRKKKEKLSRQGSTPYIN